MSACHCRSFYPKNIIRVYYSNKGGKDEEDACRYNRSDLV